MPKQINVTGKRFGRLVAVRPTEKRSNGKTLWECRCDCGNTPLVKIDNLQNGNTKSCGCLSGDLTRERRWKHGCSRTTGYLMRTYWSWKSMLSRCSNPKSPGYHYYGGCGIVVCERWRDFRNFLADMGEKPPGRSIDRIDPYGNYEPENCRWATPMEQRHNRRINI